MKNYKHLPKVDFKDIKYVYETNRWDGPLEGHCTYKGNAYMFRCVDETYDEDNDRHRSFLLIDLTPTQWKQEIYWKELFMEKVGEHCCYEECGRRRKQAQVKPSNTHKEFYDKLKEEERALILDESQYVFWYTDNEY